MAILITCLVALGALTGVLTSALLASLFDAYRRDERDNRSVQSSEIDR